MANIIFAGDMQTQSGIVSFMDDATIQCVAVSVSSVNASSTGESCLTLTLSTTSTVSGLTISPSSASICVVSADGIKHTLLAYSHLKILLL